jgi:hypothetical protein
MEFGEARRPQDFTAGAQSTYQSSISLSEKQGTSHAGEDSDTEITCVI